MSVVLHVPHASTHIPEDVREGIVLDDAALAGELLASTDHHTDRFVEGFDRPEAFPGSEPGRVRLHINRHSRLVVDPERFLDPEREATETVGRGAVYTHGHDGRVLRDASRPGFSALRADLIDRFFRPYHAEVEQLVADMLDRYGTCTIVDVHSYPRDAQAYELDAEGGRPQLCIGTDALHTPAGLVADVTAAADVLGIGCAVDTPFSGAFVPTPWLGDERVRAVMLEIRRDTYMDEATATPHDGLAQVRALVRGVVERTLAA